MREFTVADWSVKPDLNSIERSGEERHLTPRVMDLLVYLAERSGEVLSVDQIIRDVWPETFVGDHALLTAISSLRKALDDDPRRPGVIETIPKRGYRCVASTSARVAAIAVLPLQNLADDNKDDYLAAGMTEVLIAELGKVRALRVISRQSVMSYRGSGKSLPEIGRELNVGLVVEGSILMAEGRVRTTVQLIEVATDHHVWAESYEHDLGDVIGLQRVVAEAIAGEISDRLRSGGALDGGAPPVDPDAVVAYLHGRFHYWKFSPEHFERARVYLEKAIEIEPEFASAYAGLGDVWGAMGYWGLRPAKEVGDKVYAAATRAVEIDPRNADAHVVLSAYRFHVERDWEAAEAGFKKAIELNPNLGDARLRYSLLLSALDRPEAIDVIDLAILLDPLNPACRLVRAMWLGVRERFEEAEEEARHLLEIEPGHPPGRQLLADLYWLLGREDAHLIERSAWESDPLVCAALDEAADLGATAAIRNVVDLIRDRAQETYVQPTQIARLFVHAGQPDQALECLESAAASDDLLQVEFLRLSPSWNALRGHPRFEALQKSLGLPG